VFSTDQQYILTWELDLLSSLGVVVLVENFTFSYLFEIILAVETVEILCPEVDLRPPHKILNISIQIGSIAREGAL
jgi:hypothetical protein